MKDLSSIVLIIFILACLVGQYTQDNEEEYDEYIEEILNKDKIENDE